MRQEFKQQIETFIIQKRITKKRQLMITALAAIVVFCTTYALILPAITKEAEQDTYQNPAFETREEWETTLPEERSGDPLEDLLAVAKSQLDYKESETATMTDADGTVHGATRYGIWSDNPYGDWDAMFVSFCLHYAGIAEEYGPRGVSAQEMMDAYKEIEQFQPQEETYIPRAGDIVFLETTGDEIADRSGIITKVTTENSEELEAKLISIDVIEGDTVMNKVESLTHKIEDNHILGYGLIDVEAIEQLKVGPEDSEAEDSDEPEDSKVEEQADEENAATEDGEGLEESASEELSAEDELVTEDGDTPDKDETEESPVEDSDTSEDGVAEEGEVTDEQTSTEENAKPEDDEEEVTLAGDDAEQEASESEEAPLEEDSVSGNNETESSQEDADTVDEPEASEKAITSMFAAAPRAAARAVTQLGKVMNYSANGFSTEDTYIIYTLGSDGNYYAIDGSGNAVQVFVSDNGMVTTNATNTDVLKWTFNGSNGSFLILNDANSNRIYPSGSSNRVVHNGPGDRAQSVLEASGVGAKIRSLYSYSNIYRYARLNSGNAAFESVNYSSNGSVFYFARAIREGEHFSVWLDGTNGGLMSVGNATNQRYAVSPGETFTLPTTWDSPPKYDYTLLGWYDLINHKYYPPGAEVVVTENLVFYADWKATSYDIGQYNASVSDTLSTNDFITTKVFDYGVLFNVMSSNPTVSVNSSSHSETWSLVRSGNVAYNGAPTLNYIFRDWDSNGKISYPQNYNTQNTSGGVYSGLYSAELESILFGTENAFDPETGTGIIGKSYLGTGDYLFQLMNDPSSEHYGYYYYDSSLHAAAYNQSEQRFYVYDYLERTSDSANISGDGVGKYSDFLPLNSPYVNTNNREVTTYRYDGVNGEYVGVNHYTYDAKLNSNGSSTNHVATNFWFGMRNDINFYLPEKPGARDAEGNYGNQDVNGRDMHFHFSGDDDVWVLVDGELVLDIGGIHGVEEGDINFATGAVTVNGTQTGTITNLDGGEHVLTILYLERGSSQSNCAIYFNLAPRFGLNIQKEDVLTQEVLNGAEFTFYTDKACTRKAELWTSKEAHSNGEPSVSTIKIENGKATVWGFGAGNTYYIKETKPPDADQYSRANGIICLSLDKRGVASYSVIIVDEPDADVSAGFTVHGFKIDEETQQAYIVATNAPEWVKETTSVSVEKKWADNADHTYDKVTVYLTITDDDGTVRRLREIQLSEENDWKYTWDNLPKYAEDGVTPIQYGIEEGYFPGYSGTVKLVSSGNAPLAYLVTNTPLKDETTVKVYKYWDLGVADVDESVYRQAKVTMKLFANGKDTGRSITLSLKNNWQDTFQGLPYTDENGKEIAYTIVESWETPDWIPRYGEVKKIDGNPATYEVSVTNAYRWGFVHELPATGGTGTYMYTISGLILILLAGFSLLYRYLKKERSFSK